MIYAIKGMIREINEDTVVIDNNGLFYEVYVSHPNKFVLNEETLIYTYQVVREDDIYLIGFYSRQEKDVFLKLITVKGIGPKTSINILSETTPVELISAIDGSNTSYLKKLPGVGPKAASQIILDLKGRVTSASGSAPHQYDEVREALKRMGFKVNEIDKALASINIVNGKEEDIVRLALQKLKK